MLPPDTYSTLRLYSSSSRTVLDASRTQQVRGNLELGAAMARRKLEPFVNLCAPHNSSRTVLARCVVVVLAAAVRPQMRRSESCMRQTNEKHGLCSLCRR